MFGFHPPADVYVPREGKKGKEILSHAAAPGSVPVGPLRLRGGHGAGQWCPLPLPSTGHQALVSEGEHFREALSLLAAGPHSLHIPAESRWPNYVLRQAQVIY